MNQHNSIWSNSRSNTRSTPMSSWKFWMCPNYVSLYIFHVCIFSWKWDPRLWNDESGDYNAQVTDHRVLNVSFLGWSITKSKLCKIITSKELLTAQKALENFYFFTILLNIWSITLNAHVYKVSLINVQNQK